MFCACITCANSFCNINLNGTPRPLSPSLSLLSLLLSLPLLSPSLPLSPFSILSLHSTTYLQQQQHSGYASLSLLFIARLIWEEEEEILVVCFARPFFVVSHRKLSLSSLPPPPSFLPIRITKEDWGTKAQTATERANIHLPKKNNNLQEKSCRIRLVVRSA